MATAAVQSKPGDAAAAAEPAKKSKTKLIVIIAASVLLAGGGGGGAAWFFLHKPATEGTAHEKAHAEGKSDAKPDAPKKASVFVPMDPFTVNLRDAGQERYMQVSFVFETTDTKLGDKIKAQTPAIRNRLLLLLSSKESSELSSREGKEQLAREIVAEARKPLDLPPDAPNIDAVHFSNLIIQ